MRKHTLLIHHLEETWRDGLAGFGMTPEVMAQNIIDYLHSPEGRAINDVILTTWEMPGPCNVQKPLTDYLTARGIPFQHHVFGYGEVRETYEGQNCTMVQATRYADDPDQIVCIEDWHRDLAKSASVSLCGAFDGECIQDAEDMLTHVRGEHGYKKLGDLTAGTHETYYPRLDCHGSFGDVRALIEDFEERYADAANHQEEQELIATFKKALKELSKDPAFQVAALFPTEDVGHLYSEIEELNDALNGVIEDIDIKKRARVYDMESSPSI